MNTNRRNDNCFVAKLVRIIFILSGRDFLWFGISACCFVENQAKVTRNALFLFRSTAELSIQQSMSMNTKHEWEAPSKEPLTTLTAKCRGKIHLVSTPPRCGFLEAQPLSWLRLQGFSI